MKQSEIKQALQEIAAVKDQAELETLRVRFLGRKGTLTLALRGLKSLKGEKRANEGKRLNQAKEELEKAITDKESELRAAAIKDDSAKFFDVTRPGKSQPVGHLHPLQSLQYEVIQLFWQLGFEVADGPEVETDWYCFEALNIPPEHPARDMQDTFYLESGAIPRTHTSSVKIRYMENHKPPIRIIAPGSVYRNEDEDATHSWAFKQVEGLVVDKSISLSDLKGTLEYMLKGLFGEAAELRLRPNYFPYTEPSVEMDASCLLCDESSRRDCKTCSGTGWVELGGAGMVHTQVLRNAGVDPEIYSGFAFGFGLERIAMVKYQIEDIRHFWRPNLDFLKQF